MAGSRKASQQPQYNLEKVRALVPGCAIGGKVVGRAMEFLEEENPKEAKKYIRALISNLTVDDFCETQLMDLDNGGYEMVDVYGLIDGCGLWFIKFCIIEQGPCLQVWSCHEAEHCLSVNKGDLKKL
jgi:hypothetical protein